ncbi:SusC/RagA family TonB-linked outer membrane protein [Geofilum rubicundum]|uniref:TonB-dependent receptor n=1 Tax=Geofilum rubicundum JCM 15548 TaxID=1236989 RepID=A0A0E9LW93_9BACT|nr:TonB-dependent receptor [Geofilum rubicundum]GAO29140.1 TonB-dependent receptor [Geofilum rubicundum JCM 15548]
MTKNLRLLSVCVLLLSHWMVFGQTRTVTGTVTDNTSEPLPGVTIAVEGTTTGVVSDMDGNYNIVMPEGSDVLIFSFIGFKNQRVEVAGRSVIHVRMESSDLRLDEVVVVGYGTMKKSDLSGASVSVGEDQIKGSVITNIDQALQGRAAGVSSMATSGAPGASVSIRVRGQSTINSGAEPLYVVDGVILQGGGASGASLGLGDRLGNGNISAVSPLSTLNPSDIESMEILKDASATAIYGAQGANGVILITTKKGKSGQAKFVYDGMYGIQRQVNRLDMMNLREFADYSNTVAMDFRTTDDRPEFQDPSLLGVGTNWQDAIFQFAPMQQHQVSAQGGANGVSYYVSGSYMDQEGTIIGSEFQRYSFRVNLEAELKPWMKLGLNTAYSMTDERLGLAEGTEGIITYSLLTPPDIPIYNIDGGYASEVREGYTRINPIAKAQDEDLLLERDKLNGSIYLDINPISNLTWHSELGYDIGGSRGEVFLPEVTYGNWTRGINESSIQRNNNTYYQLKNYLTYADDYNSHSYSLMVGQEAWESEWEQQRVIGLGLPGNEVRNPVLGSEAKITSGFGSSAMASFFGRLTYNFDSRYYLTYTFRRDGSSNFGPKNRWANFHAFAGSWRFTEEAFFQDMSHVLSNGKLRFGWGQTGNSSIGGYAWGSAISRMPSGLGMGFRQSNIANPYIKWETQEQLNLGLDLGLFRDRINLVVDVYDKTSEDMLMDLQLPSYMGTRGNQSSALAPPKGNYGTINNKGIEVSLNTRNIVGAFEWETDIQWSANKNTLEALDGTANAHIEGYGQWSDVVTVTNIGEPLYNFYGYKVVGVYEDLADLQNSPKPAKYPEDGVSFDRYNTAWVGDLKFADVSGPDGKPDGVIDEYDRTNIGSPMPKFTFGVTNSFRYKNFDLALFLNGSYGNKIYNYTAMQLSNMKSVWDNQLALVTDRARLVAVDANKSYPATTIDNASIAWAWNEDISNVRVANPDTKIPRVIANDPNDNDRISDRYVEDGSYLRIKNITLGYTIPGHLTRRYSVDNVRVYMNIQNVYTFTEYSGYDPEVGVSTLSNNVYGLDNGRYPAPQVFTLGLNLSF